MRSVPDFPPVENPFGDPIPSVHLPNAPLGLVIVQVQFPAILAIDTESGRDLVARFQESIRDAYPVMQEGREVGIAVTEPDFVPKTTSGLIFRFASSEHAWQVSLSRSFVALETKAYTERSDLIVRLARVVEALVASINPGVCERLGVRYSSRVAEPELLARLSELVKPEVLGAAVGRDLGDERAHRVHMVTDSMYRLNESALRARWGVIPAGTTIDANIPPAPTEGFFMDVDVFSTTAITLAPTEVLERVREFCDRQYRYFRWMVTDEYLAAYGGQP
jgi:uncharacterized protein (TIGR04255 family)